MKRQIIINGSAIKDLVSFYEEINRVFMSDENWKIRNSLDAFNDLLYGGFGAVKTAEPIDLIWLDIERSKEALGYKATKAFYEEKLKPGSLFNKALFERKLALLESGTGETYFDIIMSIISDHQNIDLKTDL